MLSLAAVTVFAQSAGIAQQGGDALPYAKSYTVTGNYVVGGVDLQPATMSTGFLTGTIPMSGVPANADILAAFLYWETISTNPAQVDGVKFRGQPVTVVKTREEGLTSELSQCFTSGAGPKATHTLNMYRADVLRLLPEQLDVDDKTTGRRLVNDVDLLNARFPTPHRAAAGGGQWESGPAKRGRVVVCGLSRPRQPLTKIVVYDGAYARPMGVKMTQTLRGFLKSSANPQAKLTHIVGTGGPSNSDRLYFKNGGKRTLLSSSPVPHTSPGSDRGWSNPTFNVSSLMAGIGPGGDFGEEVSTELDHSSSYDCLTWAAIIFSTTVADRDQDGLIDRLEDFNDRLKEPNGAPLPNLKAMGASSTVQGFVH